MCSAAASSTPACWASRSSFGIDVLSFEDPDGIQLELTAPVPADA